jgi:tartrate dehydratase alpha subunit/fumarate hydratase class I-like protein
VKESVGCGGGCPPGKLSFTIAAPPGKIKLLERYAIQKNIDMEKPRKNKRY